MSAGKKSAISFGMETTFNVPVVPNKTIDVRAGDGIQINTDLQMIPSMQGQLAKNTDAFKGKAGYDGGYDHDFKPGYIGYFLKSLFGSVNSVAKSAPNATVIDHTFTEVEAKPSMTIEQAISEYVRRFAGAITLSAKFSCKAGEPLMIALGIGAMSSATATAITPTYETLRPFNFADCLKASGFQLGATVFDEVESFELEYKINGQFKHTLGSNDPGFFYVEGSEVNGKIDMYLNTDSAAKHTDYLNKTERALDIAFTGDTIGTSSNYGLQLNVPRTVFKVANIPIAEDYNKLGIEFEGLYDKVTSRLIRAVLTNLLANYN